MLESRDRTRLRRGSDLYATERELLVIAYGPRYHIELDVIDLVLASVEEHLLPAPVGELNPLHSPLPKYGVLRDLNGHIEYITGQTFCCRNEQLTASRLGFVGIGNTERKALNKYSADPGWIKHSQPQDQHPAGRDFSVLIT